MSVRLLALASLSLVLPALTACTTIWGIDAVEIEENGAGGGSSTSASSASTSSASTSSAESSASTSSAESSASSTTTSSASSGGGAGGGGDDCLCGCPSELIPPGDLEQSTDLTALQVRGAINSLVETAGGCHALRAAFQEPYPDAITVAPVSYVSGQCLQVRLQGRRLTSTNVAVFVHIGHLSDPNVVMLNNIALASETTLFEAECQLAGSLEAAGFFMSFNGSEGDVVDLDFVEAGSGPCSEETPPACLIQE